MLSACYCSMDPDTFKSLPSSTNAVESYNRFSKTKQPQILKVAMLTTYREDMAKTLQVMARQKGLPTTYEKQSLSARVQRSGKQSAARRKRFRHDDDAEGPPDTRKKFKGVWKRTYLVLMLTTLSDYLFTRERNPKGV